MDFRLIKPMQYHSFTAKSHWDFTILNRMSIENHFLFLTKHKMYLFFFFFYQSTIPFLPCHSVCRLGNWVGLCKTTSLVERLCSSRPHPKIKYMIRKILQSYKKSFKNKCLNMLDLSKFYIYIRLTVFSFKMKCFTLTINNE